MSLMRVGGKEDGGIDLVGWWWLPDIQDSSESSRNFDSSPTTPRRRIRVIAQCKAEKKKLGPNYVRELEGVLFRFMSTVPGRTGGLSMGHDEDTEHSLIVNSKFPFPLVALLISESAFTKSTLLRAYSSPIPFFLIHLPPIESPMEFSEAKENMNVLGSGICNPALSGTRGLLKGNLEVRWERSLVDGSGRPSLWWKEERLPSWAPDFPSHPELSKAPL
ncbi:hypothetical protein CVT24_000786 [Panaeolus cyanescens]|uniref:Restriction endonuclease type IV Mrr domain-containing protein n=1 Tax=Panaeolus cyanescens TaxID=181874 RepID=A0A409YCN4_9AGAR|nr:hypothetical protein CVT24_000786 [Panaeolus cyanescens]